MIQLEKTNFFTVSSITSLKLRILKRIFHCRSDSETGKEILSIKSENENTGVLYNTDGYRITPVHFGTKSSTGGHCSYLIYYVF